ncbi:MAG TPA: kelch repeat-containing protein, partial [Chthoniobacterales bacterium]|nr:kelch repeat-containing protein [Chthoniobacterales bacterium]
MKKLAFTLLTVSLLSTLGIVAEAANTIPLTPERAGHAATLLNSGLVLITGGLNENTTLNSALLYNPANGQFTPTGDMVVARSSHTSTLLNDGRVLITGGDNGPGTKLIKTAELYDPATGQFTLTTKQMSIARSKHTASLLPDGRVLIVGGKNADIFDPAAQTFTMTTNSPTNRSSHSAVTLADGSVLITGGYVGPVASNDAWIFDPASQMFTQLAALMKIPRA